MLKTVNVSKLRSHVKDVLLQVKKSKNPLIVTERGVASSVIVDIDSYEDLLVGKDRAYLVSIRKARAEYKKGAFLEMEDVFGGIA